MKSTERERQMEARQISPARAAMGTAVLMGIASVVVGYLTITQWYGVQVPTLALGGLALILGPLATVLVAPDLKRLDQKNAMLVTGINIAVAVVVALAAGMPWKQEKVRAGLLARGAALSEGRAAEFAIQDPSDAVAMSACRWIYKSGELWQRRATTQRLRRQPLRAMQCLKDAAQGDDKTLNARAELVRGWAQELLGADVLDEQAGGTLIGGLGGLAMQDNTAAEALLTCALGHSDAAFRVMCGEALANNGLTGEKLVGALVSSEQEGLAQVWTPKLLTYAYHQYGLTPDDKQTAIKLGLLVPSVRSFAMETGCDALPAMETKIVEQFKALATASCDVKGEMIRKADGLWSGVCEAQRGKKKIGTESFCEALTQRIVNQATVVAMGYVHAALMEQLNEQTADAIKQGNAFITGRVDQRMMEEIFGRDLPSHLMKMSPEARYELIQSMNSGVRGDEDTSELTSAKMAEAKEISLKKSPIENMTEQDRISLQETLLLMEKAQKMGGGDKSIEAIQERLRKSAKENRANKGGPR
jgi:hypothetical protein